MRMGQIEATVVRRKLPDGNTVEAEKIVDALETLLNPLIHISDLHIDEGGRKLGQNGFEAQTVSQITILALLVGDVLGHYANALRSSIFCLQRVAADFQIARQMISDPPLRRNLKFQIKKWLTLIQYIPYGRP